MKKFSNWLVMVIALGLNTPAGAAISFTGSDGNFSATASPGASIPDYPSSGLAYALNFDDSYYSKITGLTVTFTISGGWNGDLYAYLSHGDGFAVLLNKVGASGSDPDGYGTSGFNNITLSMAGTVDIHGVPNPTTAGGPYAADGRINYTDTTRDNTLSVFDQTNPNGDWTLYFSDLSPLSTSSLSSWSVNLTVVPEPITWAMIGFGSVFGLVQGVQFLRRRRARS